MYRQYDTQILNRVQMTEKQILKKFISICEKYNLKYFVVFGTLLGVIRHKGFIPWDDDIDVAMPREDYDKFLEVAQKECGDSFFLQTVDTDQKYHLYFAKLRMRDTEFVESVLQDAGSVGGFYIDIFPYDVIPDNEKECKKYMKKTVFYGMLLSANKVKEPQVAKGNMFVNFIKDVIWFILHYGMKILGIKGEIIWKRCVEIFTEYKYSENKRMTTFSAEACKWIVYKEEIENLDWFEFEDLKVKVPRGYDTILKRNYGDYMKLPPMEQRVNHMPVRIRFPEESRAMIFGEKSDG